MTLDANKNEKQYRYVSTTSQMEIFIIDDQKHVKYYVKKKFSNDPINV